MSNAGNVFSAGAGLNQAVPNVLYWSVGAAMANMFAKQSMGTMTPLQFVQLSLGFASIPSAPACVTALPCWSQTFGSNASAANTFATALLSQMVGTGAPAYNVPVATCTAQASAAAACFATVYSSCNAAATTAPAPYVPPPGTKSPPPSPPSPPNPPNPSNPPAPGAACAPAPPPSPPATVASCLGNILSSAFLSPALLTSVISLSTTATAPGTANNCAFLPSFPCIATVLSASFASTCISNTTLCSCISTVYTACPGIAAADAAAYNANAVAPRVCAGQCPPMPDTTTPAGQATCGFKPNSFFTPSAAASARASMGLVALAAALAAAM